jgi:hypothetical protein
MAFTESHIEQTLGIAKDNYEKERKSVPILPRFVEFLDFSAFGKNGLGVSAFDENKMVGYLCCYDPFEKASGTTNAIGVWSPTHGNGIIDCDYNISELEHNEFHLIFQIGILLDDHMAASPKNNRLLGVDFESFNPTASDFWLKYFTEYTHSVVRRIDDLFI